MKCVIFWGVTPYSPAEVHWRDRERDACCFLLDGCLLGLLFYSEDGGNMLTQKRQSTYSGLYGITSKKIVLVIENGHTALNSENILHSCKILTLLLLYLFIYLTMLSVSQNVRRQVIGRIVNNECEGYVWKLISHILSGWTDEDHEKPQSK
jgi:hypothetical protein